ncbi:MAG: hypothetical protein ACJ72W_19670 [Actinoallomurus sp.]
MSAASPPGPLHGLARSDDTGPTDPAASIEALTLRMADLCAGAVDSFEVVAGLEADGINDEVAGRYGHPHVFALAQVLYQRTERRPGVPAPPPDPWTGQVWRQLLRGVLFGLPGLCYATAAPAPARPGGSVVLLLSLLLSWSVSQGVAYLAYVRLGQGDRTAAARVMRHGLTAAGLIVPPIVALAAVLLDVGTPVTVLALGQCVYLLAATAALVGGAEPWLLLALLPGAAASTAQLAGAQIRPVVWVAWAVTVAATVGLAVACTAASDGARSPRDSGQSRADVTTALPYALFGLLAGGLLTFSAVPALLGLTRPSQATSVAVVALSLSMGFAEWILLGYRRRLRRVSLTRSSLGSFALVARVALVAAIAGYLFALMALAAAIAVPAGLVGGLHWGPAAPWIAGGHLCLGGAFFVALLLQSSGRSRARMRMVLIAFTAALTTEAVASSIGDPWVVQCAAAAMLFGVLCTYALVVLAKATPHR